MGLVLQLRSTELLVSMVDRLMAMKGICSSESFSTSVAGVRGSFNVSFRMSFDVSFISPCLATHFAGPSAIHSFNQGAQMIFKFTNISVVQKSICFFYNWILFKFVVFLTHDHIFLFQNGVCAS